MQMFLYSWRVWYKPENFRSPEQTIKSWGVSILEERYPRCDAWKSSQISSFQQCYTLFCSCIVRASNDGAMEAFELKAALISVVQIGSIGTKSEYMRKCYRTWKSWKEVAEQYEEAAGVIVISQSIPARANWSEKVQASLPYITTENLYSHQRSQHGPED